MFETRMNGGRKNQIGRAELFDAAQPLKFRRIDQLDFERLQFDVAVNGVANQFLNHYGPKGLSRISQESSEVQPFSHPFFDVEIESGTGDGQAYFVKVLSVSGHRFTYELHGPLDRRPSTT